MKNETQRAPRTWSGRPPQLDQNESITQIRKGAKDWDGRNCRPAPFFFVLFVSFVAERSGPQ